MPYSPPSRARRQTPARRETVPRSALQDPARRDRYQDCINWERLADFADVRIFQESALIAVGPVAVVAALFSGAKAVTGVNLIVDGGQHLMPLNRDVMFLTERL